MAEKKKRRRKHFVTGTAAAAVAAAGLTLGSLFTSPAELIKKDIYFPPSVELTDCLISENGDGGDETDSGEQEKKKGGAKTRLRQMIIDLPIVVRALIAVPLWVIGKILISAGAMMLNGVLSPVIVSVIKYICFVGVIIAAILLTVKITAPGIPIRKVMNRKNILLTASACAVFGLSGAVINVFWPEAGGTYDIIEAALICVFIIIMTGTVMVSSARKENIKKIKGTAD